MNNKRPVNLNLTTIHFPIMAIVSILHRVSGILLFVLLPFILYFLQLSLMSQESFTHLQQLIHHPFYQLVLWAFLSALVYHLLAGIRHLIMDMNRGEGLTAGRYSALAVIGFAVILTILLGLWIW